VFIYGGERWRVKKGREAYDVVDVVVGKKPRGHVPLPLRVRLSGSAAKTGKVGT